MIAMMTISLFLLSGSVLYFSYDFFHQRFDQIPLEIERTIHFKSQESTCLKRKNYPYFVHALKFTVHISVKWVE